jgi:hypothetical protein
MWNWVENLFARKIRLEIRTDGVLPCSYLQSEPNSEKYVIFLKYYKDLNLKTQLAHELGHFIDFVFDKKLSDFISQEYSLIKYGLPVSLPVLKFEASAWRNAQQIYPQFDQKTVKKCFSTYVSHFRP